MKDMNIFKSTASKENVNSCEWESLSTRHTEWMRRKLETFLCAYPTATQALLARISGAALLQHFSNDNCWSHDNPTLPLTLAVILGGASLSRWFSERYKDIDDIDL